MNAFDFYMMYVAVNYNPKLRFGQHMFNEFATRFPYYANQIVGTELDCFYRDDRIPNFIEFVKVKLGD